MFLQWQLENELEKVRLSLLNLRPFKAILLVICVIRYRFLRELFLLFQYPKIAPKSKPTSTIISTTGKLQNAPKPQTKLTSKFTVQQQSTLDGSKSRSSTPSSENKGLSTTTPKPLRPYGATASPQEVANAAKMLKRIEDMKGTY